MAGRIGDRKAAARMEPELKRRLALGLGLVGLLVGGLFGWSASASLSGAVIASGLVVVDSYVKKVQHPTGGVVGAINVKDGDHVNAGDVLLRLDETQARANLGIVASQLVQLIGRKARLEAERDQTATIAFPKGFEESDVDAPAVAAGERRLFDQRRTTMLGQRAQLKERIGQLRKEIQGLTAQVKSKDHEIRLMREEYARVSEMRAKELVPVQRLLSTERDLTRLEGEHGVLLAQIAKAEGNISEIELQIISLVQNMQSDAGKELREIEARIAELMERRTAAEDILRRIDLKAPRSGVVHELTVHTIGGVIGPGETVMQIVPDEETLAFEVRVAPTDIDQLALGQKATLRFPAFNRQTTPEIEGHVSQIAADLTREPQTGISYFVTRIAVSADEMRRLKDVKLVPGMPVEAFIETSQRTALSFLMKPVRDQIARAFRED